MTLPRRAPRPRAHAARRPALALTVLLTVVPHGSAPVGSGPPGPRPQAVAAASDSSYRTPVPGVVLRAFDPPAVRWGSGHRGVDLAAGAGDVVRAPAAGVVAFAGTVAGRGVLTLLHDDGLRSSFEPVTVGLHVGDRVAQGDPVATLDEADPGGHCLPASCLHWGVRRGETYLDPMALVATDPIVLLPLR